MICRWRRSREKNSHVCRQNASTCMLFLANQPQTYIAYFAGSNLSKQDIQQRKWWHAVWLRERLYLYRCESRIFIENWQWVSQRFVGYYDPKGSFRKRALPSVVDLRHRNHNIGGERTHSRAAFYQQSPTRYQRSLTRNQKISLSEQKEPHLLSKKPHSLSKKPQFLLTELYPNTTCTRPKNCPKDL